jgi:hypothetical protein
MVDRPPSAEDFGRPGGQFVFTARLKSASAEELCVEFWHSRYRPAELQELRDQNKVIALGLAEATPEAEAAAVPVLPTRFKILGEGRGGHIFDMCFPAQPLLAPENKFMAFRQEALERETYQYVVMQFTQ